MSAGAPPGAAGLTRRAIGILAAAALTVGGVRLLVSASPGPALLGAVALLGAIVVAVVVAVTSLRHLFGDRPRPIVAFHGGSPEVRDDVTSTLSLVMAQIALPGVTMAKNATLNGRTFVSEPVGDLSIHLEACAAGGDEHPHVVALARRLTALSDDPTSPQAWRAQLADLGGERVQGWQRVAVTRFVFLSGSQTASTLTRAGVPWHVDLGPEPRRSVELLRRLLWKQVAAPPAQPGAVAPPAPDAVAASIRQAARIHDELSRLDAHLAALPDPSGAGGPWRWGTTLLLNPTNPAPPASAVSLLDPGRLAAGNDRAWIASRVAAAPLSGLVVAAALASAAVAAAGLAVVLLRPVAKELDGARAAERHAETADANDALADACVVHAGPWIGRILFRTPAEKAHGKCAELDVRRTEATVESYQKSGDARGFEACRRLAEDVIAGCQRPAPTGTTAPTAPPTSTPPPRVPPPPPDCDEGKAKAWIRDRLSLHEGLLAKYPFAPDPEHILPVRDMPDAARDGYLRGLTEKFAHDCPKLRQDLDPVKDAVDLRTKVREPLGIEKEHVHVQALVRWTNGACNEPKCLPVIYVGGRRVAPAGSVKATDVKPGHVCVKAAAPTADDLARIDFPLGANSTLVVEVPIQAAGVIASGVQIHTAPNGFWAMVGLLEGYSLSSPRGELPWPGSGSLGSVELAAGGHKVALEFIPVRELKPSVSDCNKGKGPPSVEILGSWADVLNNLDVRPDPAKPRRNRSTTTECGAPGLARCSEIACYQGVLCPSGDKCCPSPAPGAGAATVVPQAPSAATTTTSTSPAAPGAGPANAGP